MPGCQKVAKKLNKDSYAYTRDKKMKVLQCGICPSLTRSVETSENQRVYANPSLSRTDFSINKIIKTVESICPCN